MVTAKVPYKSPEELKSNTVHVKFTRAELEKLDALKDAAGCTRSAVIRKLIFEEYDRLMKYR